MYLNEATLLNNIKQRYMKDEIYVSFADFFICPTFNKNKKNIYGKILAHQLYRNSIPSIHFLNLIN